MVLPNKEEIKMVKLEKLLNHDRIRFVVNDEEYPYFLTWAKENGEGQALWSVSNPTFVEGAKAWMMGIYENYAPICYGSFYFLFNGFYLKRRK